MQWTFRFGVILLLASTLVVQVLILHRMPDPLPSIASLQQAATPEAKKSLFLRRPMVMVGGSVDVNNTVDVNIENTPDVNIQNTPIAVEIQNTPLDVEVIQ